MLPTVLPVVGVALAAYFLFKEEENRDENKPKSNDIAANKRGSGGDDAADNERIVKEQLTKPAKSAKPKPSVDDLAEEPAEKHESED
jgi:hypothetical protein